jgi:hypothetical protein
MKEKLVIVSLLAVLMLSMFATASAVTKVPTVFQATNKAMDPVNYVRTTGGTLVISESGIYHVFDAQRSGKIYLKIGSDNYVGTVNVNVDYILNTVTMTTTQHYHKMTMTFLAADNYGQTVTKDASKQELVTLAKLSSDAAFEGVNTWTLPISGVSWSSGTPGNGIPAAIGLTGATLEMHGLLHGTGNFEGYILHLEVGTDSWIQMR